MKLDVGRNTSPGDGHAGEQPEKKSENESENENKGEAWLGVSLLIGQPLTISNTRNAQFLVCDLDCL